MPALRRRRRDAGTGEELEVESIEIEANEKDGMHRTHVKVLEDVLDANGTIARANRADFDREHVTVVNLMGSPGAGKTTVSSRSCRAFRACASACSRATSRARSTPTGSPRKHVPVAQINTDPSFGGECHLDANMVRSALPSLPLAEIDLLLIENVGNLVCPAEFRIGEHTRVMVTSVTEGEDKPLKYPLMFRACELVLVNKIDLLPHLDFDIEQFLYHLDAVNPGVAHRLSAGPARAWTSGATGSRRPERAGRRWSDGTARLPARLEELLGARTRRTSGSSRPRRPVGGALPAARGSLPRGRAAARVGASPQDRSDARHVAVEFVHPVIVGKRALPARPRARRARAAGRARRRRDDVRRRGGRSPARGGVPHHRLRAGRRGVDLRASDDDPFVRQELVETLYHVLWELVHVFLDHASRACGRRRAPRASSTRSSPCLEPTPGSLVDDVSPSVL